MELILHEEDFVNDVFSITYGGNRVAQFTIVNTEFQGTSGIGRINKINIWVRPILPGGTLGTGTIRSPVIGIGDNIVGITSRFPELRGKVLCKDNMSACTVILYEGA